MDSENVTYKGCRMCKNWSGYCVIGHEMDELEKYSECDVFQEDKSKQKSEFWKI